jgi:hypothetical protein
MADTLGEVGQGFADHESGHVLVERQTAWSISMSRSLGLAYNLRARENSHVGYD